MPFDEVLVFDLRGRLLNLTTGANSWWQ